MRTRRLLALAVLVLVVAAGLAVHLLMPDSTLSDVLGDALYAGAVFAFVVLLAPRWTALGVGTVAAAWCIAVELFQLTGIPVRLAEGFPPVVLALGTVFDVRDLAVYVVTVGLVTLGMWMLRRRTARAVD